MDCALIDSCGDAVAMGDEDGVGHGYLEEEDMWEYPIKSPCSSAGRASAAGMWDCSGGGHFDNGDHELVWSCDVGTGRGNADGAGWPKCDGYGDASGDDE